VYSVNICFVDIFSLQMNIVGILAVELAFVGVVVGGVLGGAHTHDKRTEIVGILCVIFGTAMYASPLSVMVRVDYLNPLIIFSQCVYCYINYSI
jgi:hypothetical protein